MQVNFDLDPVIDRLNTLEKVQVPFAASLAINTLAKNARKHLRAEMTRTFNNPVPNTLNSIYMKSSTKNNLRAELGIKDFNPKGNAAADYLLPQIEGGPAYSTRFQKSLRIKGILAPGEYAIPTQSDFLRMNQYGNVLPSEHTKALYDLEAFRDSSAFTYRSQARKRRKSQRFFVRTTAEHKRQGGKFYPGIYFTKSVTGSDKNMESAAWWFSKVPSYAPKYPFGQLGADFVNRNAERVFKSALSRAIASAR